MLGQMYLSVVSAAAVRACWLVLSRSLARCSSPRCAGSDSVPVENFPFIKIYFNGLRVLEYEPDNTEDLLSGDIASPAETTFLSESLNLPQFEHVKYVEPPFIVLSLPCKIH